MQQLCDNQIVDNIIINGQLNIVKNVSWRVCINMINSSTFLLVTAGCIFFYIITFILQVIHLFLMSWMLLQWVIHIHYIACHRFLMFSILLQPQWDFTMIKLCWYPNYKQWNHFICVILVFYVFLLRFLQNMHLTLQVNKLYISINI